MIVRVAVCVLLACLETVVAQPRLQDFSSRRYSISTDAPRDVAARIAAHMDLVYNDYLSRFSRYGVRNAGPLRLYVFSDRAGYLEFLAGENINGFGTGGMFVASRDRQMLLTWLGDRPLDGVLGTLRHEGLHQFVHQRVSDSLAQWCNEGMAEYFNYSIVSGNAIEPGIADPNAIRRVNDALLDGTALPLGDLLFITNEQWNDVVTSGDGMARVLYDQSWSVVHFLGHAQGGRFEPLLASFINAQWQGKTVEQASAEVFTRDLVTMERAWFDYITTLEADPLIRAFERLRPIAMITLRMHELGEAVRSAGDLVRLAHEYNVEGTAPTHRGPMPIGVDGEQATPWWLEMPADRFRGRPASVEIRAGRRGGLPSIRVRGLRREAAVVWTDAEPGYELVIR